MVGLVVVVGGVSSTSSAGWANLYSCCGARNPHSSTHEDDVRAEGGPAIGAGNTGGGASDLADRLPRVAEQRCRGRGIAAHGSEVYHFHARRSQWRVRRACCPHQLWQPRCCSACGEYELRGRPRFLMVCKCSRRSSAYDSSAPEPALPRLPERVQLDSIGNLL